MTEQAIITEILSDLMAEIGLTSSDTSAIARLTSKIKNAVREVKQIRNYPNHFTSDAIYNDLYNNYYSNMRELALYDYNQFGVEGQTTHNENGTNRSWKSRTECLRGIFAFVKAF